MNQQKCILIHSPKLFYNGKNICSSINYSAMGLFSLASELEKSGFETEIIHLGIEKYLNKNFSISNYIKENEIKFAAFSLNWQQQSYDVIETARQIKKNCPDTYISLGGYTATFFADEIMEKFPFIDAIIKGEGEKSITELANYVYNNASYENIPNIIIRNNNKIISNENTFVASDEDLNSYEFFNSNHMKHYNEYSMVPYVLDYTKENQLNNPATEQGICLGRGCIGNCAWCGGGYITNKLMSGRSSISYRSPENVISEMKKMMEKDNIEIFNMSFDPNPVDRSYHLNLFNKIADEFNGSVNVIYNLDGLPDKEFLDAFKNAFSDNSTLIISPVFQNEELRKKYKSFFYTNTQLEEMLSYMDRLGINSEICFSIMPGVNSSENKNSEKYGKYLQEKYNYVKGYNMYEIEIEPASPWTYTPEKFNLKNPRKTFMEYYNDNKSIDKSFESSLFKEAVLVR